MQQTPFLTCSHFESSPKLLVSQTPAVFSQEQTGLPSDSGRTDHTVILKMILEFFRSSQVNLEHAEVDSDLGTTILVISPDEAEDRFNAAETSCLMERCNSSCMSIQAANVLCMSFILCWSLAMSTLKSLIVSHSCTKLNLLINCYNTSMSKPNES